MPFHFKGLHSVLSRSGTTSGMAQSSGEKLPDTEIILERGNTMKRSSTNDVSQTFSNMRRYRSALSRKSAPLICSRIVPASLAVSLQFQEKG